MDLDVFIPKATKAMDISNYPIGSEHFVDIIFINLPDRFFVRLIAIGNHVKLLEAKGEPITSENVKIQKRVIYKSVRLKRFVRGEVLAIKGQNENITCIMKAIDYGCIDHDVSLEFIYLPASEAIENCPPLAIQCAYQISQLSYDLYDVNFLKSMTFYFGTYFAKMIVRRKILEIYRVEFKPVGCHDNLSNMCAFMDCSLLNTAMRYNIENVSELRYKERYVQVGDRFHVRVQSGQWCKEFYVAQIDEYQQYVSDVYYFTKHCEKRPDQNIIDAADGRCCGVKFEQPYQYERAIIKSVKEDGTCLVKLIDWGKVVETKLQNIKIVTAPYFTEQPAIAIRCITRKQPWNQGFKKFMYPSNEFVIEIVESAKDDKPNIVNIFKLSEDNEYF